MVAAFRNPVRLGVHQDERLEVFQECRPSLRRSAAAVPLRRYLLNQRLLAWQGALDGAVLRQEGGRPQVAGRCDGRVGERSEVVATATGGGSMGRKGCAEREQVNENIYLCVLTVSVCYRAAP